MKKKTLIILCALLMLGGCGDGGKDEPESEWKVSHLESVGQEADEREIVSVELKDQYQKAAYFADVAYQYAPGNVLVSPLSLNVAMGMVAEGTTGETAQELYRYLGREDYADWTKSYLDFADGLKKSADRAGGYYSFSYKLADAIWVKENETLKETYQKLVAEKFRATAQNVDFCGEPDLTADKINSWCDDHTEGLIKDIVSPDAFSPSLMAILTNSVYFESPWQDPWRLCEHEFTDLNGKVTTQETLKDRLDEYYENEKCVAFAKDYYNGFQFIGILPKEEGDFKLGDLDLSSLLKSGTHAYDVDAIMPKLTYETTMKNAIDVLKAQGVLKIFGADAECGNMIEGSNLFVSKIIQKCRIELDEEGTRAAAVTAVYMDKGMAALPHEEKEVKEVYLDRPFAYLIYDSVNDQIVFAGKVIGIQ